MLLAEQDLWETAQMVDNNIINVSIIIPFKNAEKTIDRCLCSIFEMAYQSYEIILVENNSTDNSRSIAKSLRKKFGQQLSSKIISETKPGPAAARNTGARVAQGRYLAFTDADCVADKNWLTDSVKVFDDDSIAAVAGNIEGFKSSNLVECFHGLFTLQGLKVSKTFESFTLDSGGFSTTNLIVRKDVFDQIRGFDEDLLRFGEDHDLCARIYRAGYKIKSIPGGTIYHIHRREISSTWEQSYYFGSGHGTLLKRCFDRYLLIGAGPLTVRSAQVPIRAWIDFDSADKKMALLILLSLFYWPLSVFIILYVMYLSWLVIRKSKSANIKIDIIQCPIIAALLLFKSFAMSAGRIQSGIKNRVICF
jgi:GT2 family glycosyltransferase